MVPWGVLQGWGWAGRTSMDVHHQPHLFPELLPNWPPVPLTSLLISWPVSILLEFRPGNQSIACSRLVAIYWTITCFTSRFAKCKNGSRRFRRGRSPLWRSDQGWATAPGRLQRPREVRAPAKLLLRLLERVGFHGTFARARGIRPLERAVPRCHGWERCHGVTGGSGAVALRVAWEPCTGLGGGGAGGEGRHRSRHRFWLGGP